MLLEILLVICLYFSKTFSAPKYENSSIKLNILMPDAVAQYKDQYLCTSFKLDEDKPTYITGFNPSGSSQDAHHMLLYGCNEIPTDKPIWNCGEMNSMRSDGSDKYETGPTCSSGPIVIYAWALDADKTQLPKDVAFKVGATTPTKYLVLQVHYASIKKFQNGEKDRSGFVLDKSLIPTSKRAGVFLMGSGGRIRAKSEEVFQIACTIEQQIVLHPFAYRTHTHRLGLTVSSYRVRGENDEQEWTEIGRKSPQLPQMFYPVSNNMTIHQGDTIAAMCLMKNMKSKTIRIGTTSKDEMCNFYMMYWVDGDQILDDNTCWSVGPPIFYFRKNSNLQIDKIPKDAFEMAHVSAKMKSRHHTVHEQTN